MSDSRNEQETFLISAWTEAFLKDRAASGAAAGTLRFYRQRLQKFTAWCETNGWRDVLDVTPDVLRTYLIHLQDRHNPGGVHAYYRTLRTFFLWFEAESGIGWRNPIRRVPAPKREKRIMPVAGLDVIEAMLRTCRPVSPNGRRDRAILLLLLDTGLRASELCDLDVADLDLVAGKALVRAGKGGKDRTVRFGVKTRRSVRNYLAGRDGQSGPAFLGRYETRLTYWGLRQIVRRRALRAGVPVPSLHSFRRAFAINFLRSQPNALFPLQKLTGHSDLETLRAYADYDDEDVAAAYDLASPVDQLLKIH